MPSPTQPTASEALEAVLVDDHEVVLEGLSKALQRDGMNVIGTFLDDQSAVGFLSSRQPDLLVIDLRLQEGGGINLVEHARRSCPNTHIAVLTSFEDRAAAYAAVQAGATGFLLKDASTKELCGRLRAIATGSVVIDSRVAEAVMHPSSLMLAQQERAIIALVAEGLTNREIGVRLHLSQYTVKEYLSQIMRKLGTSTRAETVAQAVQRGLLSQLS